jgi:hypothetical protein
MASQGPAGPSPPYEGTEFSARPSGSHWRQNKEGIFHDAKHQSSRRDAATKESLEPAYGSFPNQLLQCNAEHVGGDLGPYFLANAAMLPREAAWPPSTPSLDEPEELFTGLDTTGSGNLGGNDLLGFPHAPGRLATSHSASVGPEWNRAPNTSGLRELRRKEGFSHLKSDSAWSGRGLARGSTSGCSQSYSGGGGGGGDEPSGSNRSPRQGRTSRSGAGYQQPSNSSRDSSRPRDGITCPVVCKARKTDTMLKECRQTFATVQDAM